MDIKVDENTVVVFDLDDTLYNEMDFLKSAYTSIAKQLEPNDWKKLFAYMFSLYRCKEDVFAIIAMEYKTNKGELIETYRGHKPNITLFDGVLETIHNIRSKDGKIGILTDGRARTQMNKIEALGLTELVDCMVISEDVGTEKPNEQNFKLISDRFKDSTYYYVADNLKKDFIAPNALGWGSIALLDNGLNIHYDSYLHLNKNQMPQNFILSFAELKII